MLRILLLAVAIIAAPATAQPLRVMSFNIRLPIDTQPERTWQARAPIAAAAIRRARADVVGLQELFQRQGDDLAAALPGYRWFGIDRRGGHGDEHMGVLYNTRALRLIDSGQFWLSDTSDIPGSITWGHPYPRMVTWGVFERRSDRRRFRLLNTHLPHRAEDAAARSKGAALIVERLATLPGATLPTVLTGDFNTEPDSDAHRLLTRSLEDAWTAARRRSGPAATYHAFTGTPDRRIDWILTRGFRTESVRTLTDRSHAVWASDHFPIVADLRFIPQAKSARRAPPPTNRRSTE